MENEKVIKIKGMPGLYLIRWKGWAPGIGTYGETFHNLDGSVLIFPDDEGPVPIGNQGEKIFYGRVNWQEADPVEIVKWRKENGCDNIR